MVEIKKIGENKMPKVSVKKQYSAWRGYTWDVVISYLGKNILGQNIEETWATFGNKQDAIYEMNRLKKEGIPALDELYD
jgi:hypothetical protein